MLHQGLLDVPGHHKDFQTLESQSHDGGRTHAGNDGRWEDAMAEQTIIKESIINLKAESVRDNGMISVSQDEQMEIGSNQ